MNRLGYLLLRLLAEGFRLVPFRLLYIISDLSAFVLHHLVGYRRKVMDDNLRLAYPEKTEKERLQIRNLAYQNITDVALETIKAFTISTKTLRKRCVSVNEEVVNRHLDQGRSVIIGGAHYNNWEWLCISVPFTLHGTTVTVYKPLNNPFIENYYNDMRSKTGTMTVSMDETYKVMRNRATEPSAYYLLSDQSPSNRKSAHWVDFFGVETAFLPGLDFLARRLQLPVILLNIQRVRRGYYEYSYQEIWPEPATASEQDISRVYAKHMEKVIRKQPENWLWSHRRWKFTKQTT